MQHSQSEGSLLQLQDAPSEWHESCEQSVYDSPNGKRRHGLSKEERGCFRRYPLPSPAYVDKMETYWQNIGGARTKLTETGAHTMPNGKGLFWNKPEFRITSFYSDDDFGAMQSSLFEPVTSGALVRSQTSRRGGTNKSQKAAPLPNPLDKEEEHLARMLKHLLPSTLSEMARVGSSYRSSRRRGHHDLGSPSISERDFRAEPRSKPVSSAGSPELPKSCFLKTDTAWKPCGTIVENAMKLVQAGQGSVHRDFGGGNIQYVQDETSYKTPAYRAMHLSATSTAYLVNALQDPSRRGQKHSQRADTPPKLERSLSSKKLASGGKKTDSGTISLREFRERLLDRYATVSEAFDTVDVDSDKRLTLKEWSVALTDAGLASYREARMLFELMDSDKDGNLTIVEFHVGVESIAPVLSLEGLRKRLLCLGCNSMTQALSMMDGAGDDTTSRPLTFQEFAAALQRIYVSEPAEHRAIFEAVRSDPGVRFFQEARVSIADLACGLSAVSPSLLLEEIRCRLIKRHGTLFDAWRHLAEGYEFDKGSKLDLKSFKKLACERFGLTATEATKAFRLIDIDDLGEISRSEFIRAMNVSMPSILLEDARQKIRQRYLSIDVAFRDAFDHLEEDGNINNDTALDVEEFADILEKLEIGRKDTRRLFHIIDGESTGRLTLLEFFNGIRLFAPSSMLEGVRMQLMQTSSRMADAISNAVEDRRMNLDRSKFAELLDVLNVQCEDPHMTFDFLDVRNAGVVTVSEVIATMQNIQPGTRKLVEPQIFEERAQRFVQTEMAPFHKTVVDLKKRVKQGLREGTADRHQRRAEKDKEKDKTEDESHGRLPRLSRSQRSLAGLRSGIAAAAEGDVMRLPQAGARLLSAGVPPRTQSSQGPQSTYFKLNARFNQLPSEVIENNFTATIHQLKGYFNSAHFTLQDQKPLLSKNYSRRELHRSTEELKKAAGRDVKRQVESFN